MGFFTFDGHLITSNPAAVAAFGDVNFALSSILGQLTHMQTIWLQSDIFGMKDAHERCKLRLYDHPQQQQEG